MFKSPLGRPLSLLALATVMAGASSVVSVPAQSRAPNLLLVTLDTVRADRVGAYGYGRAATPVLDRLAREGVRFDDATTASPLTGPAHAAILTGTLPGRYGVRDNASTPLPAGIITLAEHLKEAGYETAGVVGAFVLDAAYGFAQGFDLFDARFDRFEAGAKEQVQRRASAVVDAAVILLDQMVRSRPFFLWVHFYDPHTPYDPPPPYGVRFRTRPYDGELAFADAQLGRLLEALAARDLLERTLVAAVGDHGEALGDHGESEHGIFLYDAVLRVPWIMRLPRGERAGTVIAEQVKTIDVAPTLLDVLGRAAPQSDGESVLSLIRGGRRTDPRPSYAEAFYPRWHLGWSELRSLRVGDWKFIEAPRPELYDLRTDRREQRNVIAERPSVAARLQAEMRAMEREMAGVAPRPTPDAETVARLRSLGYVGLAGPVSAGGNAADPKDRIAEFETLKQLTRRALEDIRARRPDSAIATLRKLVSQNDRAYDLHLFLGDAYSQKRDHQRALGEYDAAALLNPASAAPRLAAARLLLQQGQRERAAQYAARAASLEPGSHEVRLMLGRLREAAGDLGEAFAEFQQAMRMNSSDPQPRAAVANVALRLRMYDEAEAQFRALIDMRYQVARGHLGLGRVAEARGDRRAAAAAYRRALQLDPGLSEAKKALAALGSK